MAVLEQEVQVRILNGILKRRIRHIQTARLPVRPKNTDYVAIAEVLNESSLIGYAMITVSQWTRLPRGTNLTRQQAEVILHKLGVVAAVPDDGIIGDDDPAYEALGRGELLWSGITYKLRWPDQAVAGSIYREYFV